MNLNRLKCLLFMGLCPSICIAQSKDGDKGRIAFAVRDESRLAALAQLGSEQRIPIGVVMTDTNSLCDKTLTLLQSETTLMQAAQTIVKNTEYTVMLKGEVLEVLPQKISPGAKRVVDMTLPKFTSIPMTMNGLGSILSNHIKGQLHPRMGFAGSILSSSAMETVPPFTAVNWSVEQIANNLASTGSKGLCI